MYNPRIKSDTITTKTTMKPYVDVTMGFAKQKPKSIWIFNPLIKRITN